MDKNEIGKFIALILRHRPDAIGITLDEHGWAKVEELIAGISRNYDFNMAMLEDIVKSDNKQRYSFNDDKTLIRANQGHSTKSVNINFEEVDWDKMKGKLFHGTGEKFMESIMNTGIEPRSRQYVHLSCDVNTAIKVGSRHGKPIILDIDTDEMKKRGAKLYKSENNVYLTKNVPVGCFTKHL